MKILFLTKSITTFGGVQRVVSSLANGLAKENDVTIISNDSISIDSRYNLCNVKRENLNNVSPRFYEYHFIEKVVKKINRHIGFLNHKFLLEFNKRLHYKTSNINNLIKYINENEFDVVIGAQGDMAMYVALIKDDIKSKTIGWNHSMFECYYRLRGNYYYGQEKLFVRYMNNLDELVVLSEYDKQCFKEEWNLDVSVITNIKSFVSNEKSDLSRKNFIAIGRFIYAKGFDLLIEAFNKFYLENNEYRLTIIGEGELYDSYVNLIEKYNLQNRITIIRNIYDVKTYLLNSCCLIMPSRWEGLGMVMVEAFEVGIPVIAFDLKTINGILINNYNGVKCCDISIDSLYNGMMYYTTLNKYELQKNAINTAKLFNEEIIVEKWREKLNGIDKPFL